MKLKLPKLASTHPVAFWLAVLLHIAIVIGLIFVNPQRWELPQQTNKAQSNKSIPKAITVDLNAIKREKKRLINQEKQKQAKLAAREKHLKDLKRAEKIIENERYKEQVRLKKLKAKTKKQKQQKIQAEARAKEAERKSKKAIKKAQNEAEKKAKEAIKKIKEFEKKTEKSKKIAKQVESKIKRIKAEKEAIADQFATEQKKRSLIKEIQTETDQDRTLAQEDLLGKLQTNYINQIAARVKAQWRYLGAKDNWGCDVSILQDIDGKVQSVHLNACQNVDNSADAKAFKNSIKRAVYKASPLPYAPDKSVFDREILFYFRVN